MEPSGMGPKPLGRGARKVRRKKRQARILDISIKLLILCGAIGYAGYHSWRFIRLSYDFAVIEARVVYFEEGGTRDRGGWVEYEYYISGKRLTGRDGVGVSKYKGHQLEGKVFPLVCERADPTNTDILITENEYRFYAIPMSDSMKWIKRITLK